MKTIEERAVEYTEKLFEKDDFPVKRKDIYQYNEETFIDGGRWALEHQWHEIERDKDGFTTEQCLNEMFSENIILLHDKIEDAIQIIDGDYSDWRGDIERLCKFDYWMPIPKI